MLLFGMVVLLLHVKVARSQIQPSEWSLSDVMASKSWIPTKFPVQPFTVVWNSPTERCKVLFNVSVDPHAYGITENPKSGLVGPYSTIFYNTYFPRYTKNDTVAVYGGLPQLGNVTDMMENLGNLIRATIPDPNFDGLGILDHEAWRPLFERNWDSLSIYQVKTRAIILKEHPDWTKEQVEQAATTIWDTAARKFFEGALDIAQKLRPKGKWGFYMFPKCYSFPEGQCAAGVQQGNDRLSWLFQKSSALFPSAYLPAGNNYTNKANYVHGQVQEALRVRTKFVHQKMTPILLYSRYAYGKTMTTYFTREDLEVTMKQAADLGIDGLVYWGGDYSSNSKQHCLEMKAFIDKLLGPFARDLLHFTQTCSKDKCSGHGQCVLKPSAYEKVWGVRSQQTSGKRNGYEEKIEREDEFQSDRQVEKLQDKDSAIKQPSSPAKRDEEQNMEAYICSCYLGWSGPKCDKPGE